jgi:hypothetical protein
MQYITTMSRKKIFHKIDSVIQMATLSLLQETNGLNERDKNMWTHFAFAFIKFHIIKEANVEVMFAVYIFMMF